MPKNNSLVFPSILLGAVLAVSACGESKSDKVQTQVAAKVNKEEISVHQINGVLAKTPNITPEQSKEAGRQVLEKLIDQQLLVEQAQEKKLDRDPNTVQQLEAARREILARAYIEQMGGNVAKPSGDEIHEYFVKHPELFTERRIYSFNEISAQNAPGLAAELQQNMPKFKSITDVAEWLKQKNVVFSAGNSTKPAEQMPIELLPQLHKMKDGQIGVLPVQGRLIVMQLAASRTAPITEQQATPVIEQFLHNQRKMAQLTTEMKQLRDKAKIEYQGEFATAAAANAAPGAAPAAAATPAATPAPSAKATADQSVIDKGLSTIK